MADNRLFILCKNCQEYTGLSKKYTEWDAADYVGYKFSQFIKKHAFCGNQAFTLFEEVDNDYNKILEQNESPE